MERFEVGGGEGGGGKKEVRGGVTRCERLGLRVPSKQALSFDRWRQPS